MAIFNLLVNGESRTVDAEPEMPLLWVLRDLLNLTGTKFGCGIGMCAACTIRMDRVAVQSCLIPIAQGVDREIITIEGLSPDGEHPIQQAWMAESVSQCGYCQPGMILTAAALLDKNTRPSDADIDAFFNDHLCRCGTYQRIRRAVHRAAQGG